MNVPVRFVNKERVTGSAIIPDQGFLVYKAGLLERPAFFVPVRWCSIAEIKVVKLTVLLKTIDNVF